MTAITFPIPQADLGDLLPVQSVTWELVRQQEFSGLGSGEGLAADLAPALWEGDVSLRPLLHTKARGLVAKFDALDGAIQTFFLANPLGWWPATDPGGVIYGASNPEIGFIATNRKELSFTDLPPNYVLSAGDMFMVEYGTPARRALHRLVGDITANGSGTTGLVEVRPHLRSGIVEGLAASFKRPAAKVKLIPNTLTQQFHSANRTRISFRVRQTLAAG
ncbi:hypothetical protein JP75_08065 [Devosia riboflavina]|uniref:Uncharacterized protein n=1 Tax=Devosia riboflavina TaxID=46914 RepID=A0A087M3N3_9HYPH|nr:hypothetical protein [Devosia riboflavina]KFL31486.1 hypothetical protein JP75_08065 [Devosia riboflavina]